MKLEKGRCYTNSKSDLKILIHAIHYQSETKIKVKASLFQKYNNMLIEKKNYVILKTNTLDWYLVQ